MLLALIICHLSVILANPFHKYPFVYLLDVGNEELQNTHTDQIRLSVPGGSVALRYPAIGDGETITHVRVSGIDFGTDLKANIVDGGPGYKYVVFVFMGNSGTPYDAVVTLKTISNDKIVQFNVDDDASGNESQVSNDNDPNDSAEDFNDNSDDDNDGSVSQTNVVKSNAELTQSSSNVYAYAQKEEVNSDDYDDDDDEKDNVEKDIHVQNKQNYDQIDEQNVETKDYVEDDETEDQDEVSDLKAEKYSEDYAENDQQQPIRVVDRNLYEKYETSKPHLYDGVEVYPQDQVQQNVQPISEPQSEPLYDEDSDEFEQMFNDEEVHNDANKYRDTNNNNYNNIDADDPSAVAY